MSLKQVHYNLDKIESKGAIFNIIFGEKSNGKSYQVKHKRAVENYINNGNRFILLRRWREDLSNLWIEQYFADVDVYKLTKGQYTNIVVYRKTLYFANITEEGKTIKGDKIGYVMALSTEQHYSGGSFLDVTDIIFEEFMERGQYLKDEVNKLEYLYSTIDRKRGTTRVWLVGNSVSKVNPYIQGWKLDKILKTIKQGEIKTIDITKEENSFSIAIEYCRSSGGKQMSIANNMIDTGAWVVDKQPKIYEKDYDTIYTFGFQYKGFRFLCRIMTSKENCNDFIFFINPHVKDFKENTIVFTDIVKPSVYYQRDIYNCTFPNETLKNLFREFKESKIFYSDDTTGTEFKQCVDFIIKR